jgi:hypothetical protein
MFVSHYITRHHEKPCAIYFYIADLIRLQRDLQVLAKREAEVGEYGYEVVTKQDGL